MELDILASSSDAGSEDSLDQRDYQNYTSIIYVHKSKSALSQFNMVGNKVGRNVAGETTIDLQSDDASLFTFHMV